MTKAKPKSKRGGARPGAGRKRTIVKAEELTAKGVITGPAEASQTEEETKQSDKPTGRPSSYKSEYASQAEKLCRLGATDRELADFFEVDTTTIWRWAHKHDLFCNAIKTGKDFADERVERSLYQRAVGYQVQSVKIFMPAGFAEPVYAPFTENVQPETTACIFWLKNRRPDMWRDKREVEIEGDGLAAIMNEARRRAKENQTPSSLN